MPVLDITEVSRRSGLPASALRFYEQRGLITSIGRRGLHRTFDASVVERLALIALGQAVGFSLGEVARVIGAGSGPPRINRASLAAKADELDRTIQRLGAMRDALRGAAACPAPSHIECRHFRRFMRLAGSGTLRPFQQRGYSPRRAAP